MSGISATLFAGDGNTLFRWLEFGIIAFVSAACFAIVFRTPKRYFIHTVVLGMITCLAIHLFPKHVNIGFSTATVALLIGSLSHIIARTTGQPAQGFLIPSVMFLVPGTYVYRAFSSAVARDYNATAEGLLAAVTITLAISFGLLLANWLVPSRRTL